jgi:hypothetical protein
VVLLCIKGVGSNPDRGSLNVKPKHRSLARLVTATGAHGTDHPPFSNYLLLF